MKKVIFLFVLSAFCISCEKTGCCSTSHELSGRYIHEIPNCDSTANPEINCTEFIEFIDDSEVDLLYGGGDIVYRFSYIHKGNILDLEGPLSSSFKVSFEIKDNKTLIRLDNGDVWRKKE